MRIAIELARKAYDAGEIPVGCVITDPNGNIVSSAHNETSKNCLYHAEILAINRALSTSKRLDGHILYVTLEPCPLCAAAISLAHIETLYYGARDNKMGAIESCLHHFEKAFHHTPQVYGGIHEKECGEFLTQFFEKKRQS